jgi:hypothetical protein
MPRAEKSAVPLEGSVGIAEDLPLPASEGVSHGGTALPQCAWAAAESSSNRTAAAFVALDQHPVVRQPGWGPFVEEHRHHGVVEQVKGDRRESVLEAAERLCRGDDSHDMRW